MTGLFEKVTHLFDKTDAQKKIAEQLKTLKNIAIDGHVEQDGTITAYGDVDISAANFESLPDLSLVRLHGRYLVNKNRIVNLEGAPMEVFGAFICSDNPNLSSLKGAPQNTGDYFFCDGCPSLKTLAHAPRTFKWLNSDLGDFYQWIDIPYDIRLSNEEKQQDRQKLKHVTEVGPARNLPDFHIETHRRRRP